MKISEIKTFFVDRGRPQPWGTGNSNSYVAVGPGGASREPSLIQDTVTSVIERDELDPERANYEPRGVFQDRETGDIALFVTDANKPGTSRILRCDVSIRV